MIDFAISEELKSILSKFGIRNNGVIELNLPKYMASKQFIAYSGQRICKNHSKHLKTK